MFRKLILHIQRQPRETRGNYALAGAVMMTTLLAFVWLGYIAAFPGASVYTASVGESRSVEPDRTSEAAAPLSGFWGQLKEQFAELRSIGESAGNRDSGEPAATPAPVEDSKTRGDASVRNDVTITHEPAISSSSTE